MAACSEIENDRVSLNPEIALGMKCDQKGEGDSDRRRRFTQWNDIYSIWGLSPTVQNVVKGARYCGKRGGVAFKDAIRPQTIVSNVGQFECPNGYTSCIENVPTPMDLATAEIVICRPNDKTAEEYCPITSFSFDLNTID